MFKMLRIKSLLIFVTAIVIGGMSIKNLSMFQNIDTAIEKSQDSYIKENYINDIATDFSNTYKNDIDKNLSSLSDTKNLIDNFQYDSDNMNQPEIINSDLEKTNNNSISEQAITIPQLKNEDSNVNTKEQVNTNEQMDTSHRLQNTNNNIDTKNQESINEQVAISSLLEDANDNIENQAVTNDEVVKIPTIYYDRTTSIYANDNITLLRVEYYINNKLTYYSVIEQFDDITKSYVEKIYQCNRETNIDPLIRTDVYVNGNLTKSY